MRRTVKLNVTNPDTLLHRGNLWWHPSFEAIVTDANESITEARLKVIYDETLHRYACTSIAVEPPGKGAELTGATLRDIRIAETLQVSALENIYVDAAVVPGRPAITHTFDGEDHYSAADTLRLLPAVEGNTTDSDMQNAVLAYAIAEVSGMPVLRTINQSLSTSQSTAKRLVARARELGYIDG